MLRPVLGLVLLGAATVSCGTIPPYSQVRQQDLVGKNAIKLRGSLWSSMNVRSEDATFPKSDDVDYEVDRFSTYGIEFERLIGNQFTVGFSYDTRDIQLDGTHSPIQGEQISLGLRRYFGNRALTAFVLGQLIYHQSLDFPGELGLDLRESDDFLGIGLGGGANLAITEHFSIESYLTYEISPDVDTFKRRIDGPDAPVDLRFAFSGLIAYVGIGFHF